MDAQPVYQKNQQEPTKRAGKIQQYVLYLRWTARWKVLQRFVAHWNCKQKEKDKKQVFYKRFSAVFLYGKR